jgi:hypothetical protein
MSLRAAVDGTAAMWTDQVARMWTLLQTSYEREVRPAARFLFRGDPGTDVRFPSLIGATRVVATPRAKHATKATTAGGSADDPT